MLHTYFVPRNKTKLTTRGGTSPDGVEMNLTPSGDVTIRRGSETYLSDDRGLLRSNGEGVVETYNGTKYETCG